MLPPPRSQRRPERSGSGQSGSRWRGLRLLLACLLSGGSVAAAPRQPRTAGPRPAASVAPHLQAARDAARNRLLAAQARRAGDLLAEHAAAAQAGEDRARALALSARARDEAAHLRETETRAADTLTRIEALAARRQALGAELARDAAALAPMLPLVERLSLYPAETLLASSAPPADALSGLMVLRGLGAQLEARAEAIRERQRDLARLSASLEARNHDLAALRQEQAVRGAQVSAEAERAAAAQRASQTAADAASRQAAATAARAATLQDAVSRIEAAQRAAEARFQREAEAAERIRKPEIARTARANAASISAEAGPGPVPGALAGALAAPVAGREVQGWGAKTDAGPATGITYAPPALAVVTAPCDGRIDFAGPFRSYGQMLILDCGHSYRFVLAGLDRLDVAVGQTLAKGGPVGRMPDWSPTGAGGRPSPAGRPSLYVQLRHGSEPIDPSGFLRGRS